MPKQLKYKQIETELRQLAKTLPADAKLPAERDLAIEYSCNFLTIRKALKKMVEAGLIVRRVGSGTFIVPEVKDRIADAANGDRVGMLVYQPGNAYAFSVVQAVAHVTLAESIDLRSYWVNDFETDGLRQAAKLAKEGCSSLILPWFPPGMAHTMHNFVRNCPLPVSIPMLISGLERNCFEAADLYGTTMLKATQACCQYFTHLGHDQIAFLGPDLPNSQILQQRLGAYAGFMYQKNLAMLCGLVESRPRSMDQLAERWKAFRGHLAIVSYDDEHALRLMTSMHKIGLSAPSDYAIVGYNNVDASHYSDPPLSTVRQNFDYIAHWLVKSARALGTGKICQSSEGPALELIVRATCGGRSHVNDDLRKSLAPLKLQISVQL